MPMENPLPISDYQQQQDREQIKLLAILHFVFGGLSLLGILFLSFHYLMLSTIIDNQEIWESAKGFDPHARALFGSYLEAFVWFYLFLGVACVASCILNIISGVLLRRRKHRKFSMIIAGLDCAQVPFGTALGIFTLLVLQRESVMRSYPSK